MSLISDSREVLKLVSNLANAELLEKVSKLNEEVLNVSGKNVELQQLCYELKARLADAESKLKLAGELQRHTNGYYYQLGDSVARCPRCWEKDRVLISIVQLGEPGKRYIGCPECKTKYFNMTTKASND